MHMLAFPGCCTAGVLTGFGQTETGDTRYRPKSVPGVYELEKVEYRQLRQWVEKSERSAKRQGDAILFATTNSDQIVAEKVFTDLGWMSTHHVTKTGHADKTLRGWMKPLDAVELDDSPADDLDIKF